jgi:2-polyprenyl-3-methyl-5-hydroxy-6-metoxy-1,4-benzoquinol methylase
MTSSTSILSVADFDADRSESFSERLLCALNESAMIMMTSLGHRVGLFDAMDGAGWVRSAGVAERAGLSERYVREWLSVMATSRVVEYRASDRRFRLPPEHAAWLTRRASPNNIAVTAQFLPCFASVESRLVDCFRTGDGLLYDAYGNFHEVMAEDSAQTVLTGLFESTLPMVPGLVERLEKGVVVADLGCGAGRALIAMAERFPNSHFEGFDLCEEPIEQAKVAARSKGLANICFEVRDLAASPVTAAYDFITTFDAVHDQRNPAALLKMIHDALANGGVYLMQDIAGSRDLEKNMDHPFAPLVYTLSTTHCTCVSLGQGGPGLGTMWGEETALEMLAEAGFDSVRQERLPHDPLNVYFIARSTSK